MALLLGEAGASVGMVSANPTATPSDGRPSPPKLPGERTCMDPELRGDVGE
jgi:hypothetical protein